MTTPSQLLVPLEILRDDYLQPVFSYDGAENEIWYIKTWHVNDPFRFDSRELPMAIIKPGNVRREDMYVQEDTEYQDLSIHFFSLSVRKVVEIAGQNEAIQAMIRRAIDTLRVDPTLGHQVIGSRILGATPKQPGFIEGHGQIHSTELRWQGWHRRLWRNDDLAQLIVDGPGGPAALATNRVARSI